MMSEDGYVAVDTHQSGWGCGDIPLEDEVVDNLVVAQGVDVVAQGGGDFYLQGVDAGVQQRCDIVVDSFAVPFHTAGGSVDYQFADVVHLTEVENRVGPDAVEGQVGGVGDGA